MLTLSEREDGVIVTKYCEGLITKKNKGYHNTRRQMKGYTTGQSYNSFKPQGSFSYPLSGKDYQTSLDSVELLLSDSHVVVLD